MIKEKISFDEIALLTFLKFGRLDGIDITILKNMISDRFEVVIDDATDNYFVMNDGTIILDGNYINNICNNINRGLVEKIRKMNVYKYLSDMNNSEFVLRKIKLMGEGTVLEPELNISFSVSQLKLIQRLYTDGYIMEYCHRDSDYGDYDAIKLTKKGDLYLYMIDNRKEIDMFSNLLMQLGCDESLVPSFLISQDLEENISKILTVNNFMEFCSEYGLNMFSKNEEKGLRKVKE